MDNEVVGAPEQERLPDVDPVAASDANRGVDPCLSIHAGRSIQRPIWRLPGGALLPKLTYRARFRATATIPETATRLALGVLALTPAEERIRIAPRLVGLRPDMPAIAAAVREGMQEGDITAVIRRADAERRRIARQRRDPSTEGVSPPCRTARPGLAR